MDMARFGWRGALGFALALGLSTACGDDSSSADSTEVVRDSGSAAVDSGKPSTPGTADAGGPAVVVDSGKPATAPADAGSATASSTDGGGEKTLVEVALADGRFTTLAKALTDTGLVATLQGAGPFTVFAPTDAAFAALPTGTLAALTSDQLKTILTYHVIGKELTASKLSAGPVTTVAKLSAFVALSGGTVKVNDATVTTADVTASNGVIHVIDKVLLPPNLVQAAQFAGSFTALVGAVTKAGLADTLSAAGANLTVFAPTDTAFAALPAGTVDGLSTSKLGDLLKYHVVAGEKLSTDLSAGSVPTLLTGKNVTVNLTGGVKINDANVVIADVLTTNGVIHAIDKVLTPPN